MENKFKHTHNDAYGTVEVSREEWQDITLNRIKNNVVFFGWVLIIQLFVAFGFTIFALVQ